MPLLESKDRPSRRHVRVRCELRVQDTILQAYSNNLSTTGLYVRVPVEELQGIELGAGLPVAATFRLPDEQRPLSVAAEIAWLNSDDRDVGGRKAMGLGMTIVGASADTSERLAQFVDTFRYRIMVVDDSRTMREVLHQVLGDEYRIIQCASGEEALKALEAEEVGVLITDLKMPGMGGLELLNNLAARLPYSQVIRIVLSAHLDVDELREYLRLGVVFHYVAKPFDHDYLRQVVRRAVDAYAMAVENEWLRAELERANLRLTRENAYLRQRVTGLEGFEHIIGQSQSLRAALVELERVRHTDAAVTVLGDTGTGKELVARALHFGGPRAKGPFVAQNCGGMTETLLQSTLFGHRKGAFTGADRDRLGLFAQAHGGTLFLDEVAELPAAVQAGLLRVLQNGEITPVGASLPRQVDVRIISATHKDLANEVQAGRFREDLYFRLNVIEVRLPPLREREGDVALLARHFLDLLCERYGKSIPGFAVATMAALEQYAWPGNVRELEHTVERMVILGEDGQKLQAELLPSRLRATPPAPTDTPAAPTPPSLAAWTTAAVDSGRPLAEVLDAVERALVEHALQRAGGNHSEAARRLGVPRQTLQRRAQKLGL
ncbi:MAG: sigma 54-interacting transcriptional regulator [Deltaproteobacteria bacterium]|nr:sigma 54-interacting transcriptional regulator [Deltaproteobacteria bacterium]